MKKLETYYKVVSTINGKYYSALVTDKGGIFKESVEYKLNEWTVPKKRATHQKLYVFNDLKSAQRWVIASLCENWVLNPVIFEAECTNVVRDSFYMPSPSKCPVRLASAVKIIKRVNEDH